MIGKPRPSTTGGRPELDSTFVAPLIQLAFRAILRTTSARLTDSIGTVLESAETD